MNAISMVCEQAIFTSARGPTGEGYRIVAASKGLRGEEKQKITKCSPSHESLCIPGESEAPMGVACYALPGGRLCVATSRHLGAEQSGRGGQRVYTHNLIISTAQFETCGFNPFHLVRATPQTAIDLQKLPPGGMMSALEMSVGIASHGRMESQCVALLPQDARMSAIQTLLDGKPMVVDLPKDWLTWAEALLLSIPAPLRTKVSFAAGLRFSVGRGHTLHILRDEKNAVQGKVVAQGIQFVGPKTTASAPRSNWLCFVDRHWVCGDLAGLARRTSRNYEDCSAPARERVGELFNAIDALPQTEVLPLLDLVFRTFNGVGSVAENEIRKELRTAAQHQLLNRLSGATWAQVKPVWFRLVEYWRNGGEAASFAQPLINLSLTTGLRSEPLAAVELALTVAQAPPSADREAHEETMRQVVSRLAMLGSEDSPEDPDKVARLVGRWRSARPGCPLVSQIVKCIPATHRAGA